MDWSGFDRILNGLGVDWTCLEEVRVGGVGLTVFLKVEWLWGKGQRSGCLRPPMPQLETTLLMQTVQKQQQIAQNNVIGRC